jgi:hypothetical protein
LELPPYRLYDHRLHTGEKKLFTYNCHYRPVFIAGSFAILWVGGLIHYMTKILIDRLTY